MGVARNRINILWSRKTQRIAEDTRGLLKAQGGHWEEVVEDPMRSLVTQRGHWEHKGGTGNTKGSLET